MASAIPWHQLTHRFAVVAKYPLRTVFDEPKLIANRGKHGFDMDGFADGFDFTSAVEFEAYINRTGRSRVSLIGSFNGALVVVAIMSPLGSEALALVSRRPAKMKERVLHGF